MKQIVKFTNSALNQLSNSISNKNIKNPGVFFYLNSSGCNGFSYQFDIVKKQPSDTDRQIEIIDKKEIPIYICKKSQMFLFGTIIDWKKDIMGYRYDFNNPLAKSHCGCKSSFSTYH